MASCTIQKHQRLPGYHVEWNSNKSESKVLRIGQRDVNTQFEHESVGKDSLPRYEDDNATVSQNLQPTYLENEFAFYSKVLTQALSKPKKDSCDLIITASGDFLYASSIDKDGQLIRFIPCADSDDVRKVIAKDQVFMIKYKDGSKEVMNKAESEVVSERTKRHPINSNKNKGFRFIDEVSFVGFIFGAASLPVWFFHWQIGFFISIFAIVMGVVGIIRIAKSRGDRTGLGFAIASLVLGLGLFIATLILHITVFV